MREIKIGMSGGFAKAQRMKLIIRGARRGWVTTLSKVS